MLSKKYNNFVFVADGWKRKYNNNYKLKREILAKTNSIKKKLMMIMMMTMKLKRWWMSIKAYMQNGPTSLSSWTHNVIQFAYWFCQVNCLFNYNAVVVIAERCCSLSQIFRWSWNRCFAFFSFTALSSASHLREKSVY